MTKRTRDYYENRCIWIVGATTGIGRALAFELAGRGARVIASGRNRAALNEMNKTDGRISSLPLDVSDRIQIDQVVDLLREQSELPDSMVYMAGYYNPGPIHKMQGNDLDKTLQVNLAGAFELVGKLLPDYYQRKSGQIALVASVAGYAGLPYGQPYSATKAALINLAESLYSEASRKGVDVKLINPGFVETPMTDKNEFEMPDVISSEEAAKEIADGLSKNCFEIHFPKKFTRKLKLLRLLPYKLLFRITNKL